MPVEHRPPRPQTLISAMRSLSRGACVPTVEKTLLLCNTENSAVRPRGWAGGQLPGESKRACAGHHCALEARECRLHFVRAQQAVACEHLRGLYPDLSVVPTAQNHRAGA
eukprot:9476394-Pyramimonas_sp.AAC.2